MDKEKIYWVQVESCVYWTGCDAKTYVSAMAHVYHLENLCYVDKEFAHETYNITPAKLASRIVESRVWERWNLYQEGIDRAAGLGL